MVIQGYEGLFREDYWLNSWGCRDHDDGGSDTDGGAKLIIAGIENRREDRDLHSGESMMQRERNTVWGLMHLALVSFC